MAHDVFVSHSTQDKLVADAVCAALESDGIRCWMAPRDIKPGGDWASSIVGALEGSKIMVLVFSKDATDSTHVKKELTVAVDNRVVVVPLKIDDTPLEGMMRYHLSDTHWLDAMSPPSEQQLAQVVETVETILESGREGLLPEGGPRAAPKKRRWWPALVAVALAAALGIGGWLVLGGDDGVADLTGTTLETTPAVDYVGVAFEREGRDVTSLHHSAAQGYVYAAAGDEGLLTLRPSSGLLNASAGDSLLAVGGYAERPAWDVVGEGDLLYTLFIDHQDDPPIVGVFSNADGTSPSFESEIHLDMYEPPPAYLAPPALVGIIDGVLVLSREWNSEFRDLATVERYDVTDPGAPAFIETVLASDTQPALSHATQGPGMASEIGQGEFALVRADSADEVFVASPTARLDDGPEAATTFPRDTVYAVAFDSARTGELLVAGSGTDDEASLHRVSFTSSEDGVAEAAGDTISCGLPFSPVRVTPSSRHVFFVIGDQASGHQLAHVERWETEEVVGSAQTAHIDHEFDAAETVQDVVEVDGILYVLTHGTAGSRIHAFRILSD